MTERWISTKKHYCKYCNTWIPDTKVSRANHDASDRHKNAMQRNLTRIQRDELIKRNSGGNVYAPKPVSTATATATTRKPSLANYGYGERDDMIGFIREGRKKKFDESSIPTAATAAAEVYAKAAIGQREGNMGKWEVAQVITPKTENKEDGPQVKEEENEEHLKQGGIGTPEGGIREQGLKRERQRTPDVEDLLRFRVEEKSFPTEVKEEGEEVKVVAFKKRKGGMNKSIQGRR